MTSGNTAIDFDLDTIPTNETNGIVRMGKIDLEEIQSRVLVRTLKLTDYDAVVKLQLKCFPGMSPWKKEEFESQTSIFPEGQICVEFDDDIVASSSSLIIRYQDYADSENYEDISHNGTIKNHDQYGDSLYGIEIMVHPDFQGMKLARRLYDARKQLSRDRNLRRIVIGGRMPGYASYKESISAREYVDKVSERSIFDPVLTVQLANGFVLQKLLKAYLKDDHDSSGYATLLEWVNLDYDHAPAKRSLIQQRPRICAVQYQMREIKNFKAFAAHCEYFVDVASNYKSDFVLFPELVTNQLLSCIKERRPAKAVRQLAQYTPQVLELFGMLAVKYDVNIIGGSHLTLIDDKLFNVAYLFRRDGSIEKQDKLHITHAEHHWWGVTPGDGFNVFETDRGKIAILIGSDIEFPEVSRIAAERGAEIIFVPFCADERYAYLRVRYCAQARAIENQVFVAIAGTVGNLPSVNNMDIQYAQSGIYTPSDFPFPRDAIASECSPNIETVLVHDVDLGLLARHRKAETVLNLHNRRLDLYRLHVKEDTNKTVVSS